jgi:hypothetical protein
MKRFIGYLLPIIALSCSVAFGDKPQVDIDHYAERSKQERPAAVAATKEALAHARKNTRVDKGEREAEVARLEKLVADLENPLLPYYATADFTLENAEIGSVGRLSKVEADVYQVADAKDAIIVAKWEKPSFTAHVEHSASAVHDRIAAAASSSGPDPRNPEKLLWCSGVSTSGTQDGGKLTLDGPFVVGGNHTYQSAVGPATILSIKPFSPGKEVSKFTRKDDVRTWTTKSGDKSDAIFVRLDKGHAMLVTPDGKDLDLELDKLSDDDRSYIRKFTSEQTKLAKHRP